MKVKDKFEEAKIKMVMKLKKLSYSAAVEEIARMDAVRKEEAEKARKEASDQHGCDSLRSTAISRSQYDDELMLAKEFFGEA